MRILLVSVVFLGIVSLILAADDETLMISKSNDSTITITSSNNNNNKVECVKNNDCPIINCIQAPCPIYVCHQNKCDIRHHVQVQPVQVVTDPVPIRPPPSNSTSIAPVQCGKKTCQHNEVCCNKSCSICTPKNSACIQKMCNDNVDDDTTTATARIPRRPPVQVRVPVPPSSNDSTTSTGSKNVKCGPKTCTGNDVCCNESCGICTPKGSFCSMMLCADAGGKGSGGVTPVTTKPITKSIPVIAPAKSLTKPSNKPKRNKPKPISISSGSCRSDGDCPNPADCLLGSKRCPNVN